MPERCWRCLETELTEARARIAELKFTHGHKVRDLETMIQNEHKLYADAHDKILAAQESQREALQACAELERENEALQSRNAAEKAAALRELLIWLKPRWIEAHDYIARFYPPGAARTPAPDAKAKEAEPLNEAFWAQAERNAAHVDRANGSAPDAKDAADARAPLKPEELVGALHDPIHPVSGQLRSAKAVAVRRRGEAKEATESARCDGSGREDIEGNPGWYALCPGCAACRPRE